MGLPALDLTSGPKSHPTARLYSDPPARLLLHTSAAQQTNNTKGGGDTQIINSRSEGNFSGRFYVWDAGPFIVISPNKSPWPLLALRIEAKPKPHSNEYSGVCPDLSSTWLCPWVLARLGGVTHVTTHTCLPPLAPYGDPVPSVLLRKSLSMSKREKVSP